MTITLILLLFGFQGLQAQCLDWLNPSPTTGWTDLNTAFGGAPCDDGTGCPFNEFTGFEVWAAEAYVVDNFQEGGTYAFSICNGPNAGSWVPEFTIIAPSGAVDAFGAGDGDGCTITWTASESGAYLIVINEAGACGGGPSVAVDNGYPALTCVAGPEVACVPFVCSAGTMTTTGTSPICEPGGTFQLETTNQVVPAGGGFGWVFLNNLGGTGALNGNFILTGAPTMVAYNNDLNGILATNMLPPLAGTWILKAAAFENPAAPFASICSFSTDSLIVIFGSNPTLASIEDNGDGSATVMVTGGKAPYTYMWSDGQTTQTATDLNTGTYTVVVTDADGCSVSATVDVVVVNATQPASLRYLSVGPNPNPGVLYLNLELNTTELVHVRIFDLQGRLVHQSAPTTLQLQRMEINLEGAVNGLYLVHVRIGEESVARKVVLSR
jgi:hypothetical protein